MSLHRILRSSYDLFRSKLYPTQDKTLLGKLKSLKEAVDNSREVLGYQDSKLDMTPEDLLNDKIS